MWSFFLGLTVSLSCVRRVNVILASRTMSLMLLEQYFRTREPLGQFRAGVEASTAFLSTYHFPLILAVIDGLGLGWGWDCFFYRNVHP